MTVVARQAGKRTPANASSSPVLHAAFMAFVWVVAVGLNPLRDRASGTFEVYAEVGSQRYLLFYVGLALVCAFGLFRQPARLVRLFDPALIMLLLWAAISLASSVRPLQAATDLLKQFIFILGTASFLGLYGSNRRFMTALSWCLLFIIAADVLAVIAVPRLAIHQLNDAAENNLAGAWRGLHEHKGKFGELLAVASVLCYFDWRNRGRWWLLAAAVGCYALTFPAGSKVSSAAALVAIAATEVIVWFSRRVHGLTATILIAPVLAIAGLTAAVVVPLVLEISTGDLTLTGRTKTWTFLWDYAAAHPWLGSGFGSFFIGEDGPLYQSGDPFLMNIGNAHNSYLDMLVTLGWPGLVLAVLALLIVPVVTSYRALGQPEARVWLGLLLLTAVTNVTSISYFQPQRAIGLALVAAYFGLRWARLRSLATLAIPDRSAGAASRGRRPPGGTRAADPSVRDHPRLSPAGGR